MPRSPFADLDFHQGLKLADKMGIERYETPEYKAKLKQKAVDKIVEALTWFLEPSPYDAATSRAIAKERLKEYRKHQ